jgi:hypothetical protein
MTHFPITNPTRFTSSTSHSILLTDIMQEYGKWLQEHIDNKCDAYLFTIMFRHISGSKESKIQQMHRAISRMYRNLVTRVVRKPRSEKNAELLPKGIFIPDVPAYKKSQYRINDVSVNDGIHVHGVVITPQHSRLKEPLHLHCARKSKLYVRGKIIRIQVDPIRSDAAFVADYAGKALKKRRFSNNDVLILPKTVKELPTRQCCPAASKEMRAIKDIQSATNVSNEVARGLLVAKTKKRSN